MALQKSFTNQQGHTGDYWRVDAINMERNSMKMECRLNLYKSKADRDDGKRRMDIQKTLVIDIPLDPAKALLSVIYEAAATIPTGDQAGNDSPYFSDAVDI